MKTTHTQRTGTELPQEMIQGLHPLLIDVLIQQSLRKHPRPGFEGTLERRHETHPSKGGRVRCPAVRAAVKWRARCHTVNATSKQMVPGFGTKAGTTPSIIFT